MGSYQLSKAAASDLDALYLHGILEFGLQQADQYFDGLVRRLQTVTDHPSWGADYNFIAPALYRYEYGSHSIYYQIGNDSTIIVRILGNTQDPARHL